MDGLGLMYYAHDPGEWPLLSLAFVSRIYILSWVSTTPLTREKLLACTLSIFVGFPIGPFDFFTHSKQKDGKEKRKVKIWDIG